MKKIFSILELGLSLAKTKFKLRHEGSYLGIFWYLLDPLSKFGILYLLGGALNQNTIPYYPVYLFLGIMVYDFFAAVTHSSIHVMASNANFINSMCIDKEPFVISTLLECIFSHIFSFIILITLILVSGIPLPGLIWYICIYGLLCFFVLGMGFFLAAVGVYVTDLSNVWGIFTHLLWLATPIFYSVNENHPLYVFNQFNPLNQFISAIRDAVMFGDIPSWQTWGLLLLMSIASMTVGLSIFHASKDGFSERL